MQFELSDPVLTIGMDVLRKLHIYMAFKENKLYLTPASAPAQPSGGVSHPEKLWPPKARRPHANSLQLGNISAIGLLAGQPLPYCADIA